MYKGSKKDKKLKGCLISESATINSGGYHRMPSALWLHFVTKDQVGGQSEDQEENTQHHEVYIELGIFHIQQL